MGFNINELNEGLDNSRIDEYMTGQVGSSYSGENAPRIENARKGAYDSVMDGSGYKDIIPNRDRKAIDYYTNEIIEKNRGLFPDRKELERKVYSALRSIPMASYKKILDYVINGEEDY